MERFCTNKRRVMALLALGLGMGLAACSAEGLPASRLLTPIGQAAVITATPEPVLSDSATPSATLPLMTDTPAPSATLPPTATHLPTDTPQYSPTFGPSPTRTRTATRTRYPTRTPLPTNTPTITLTPTPMLAWMRIQKPGPYSKISSPLQVEALIEPGADGNVYARLIGEDGRLITEQTLDFHSYADRHFYISPEIPFTIPDAGETARLEIHVVDEFNRTTYLCSVDLVLLQVGKSEIYANPVIDEPYIVRSPLEKATVSGGVLEVSGVAQVLNDQPLIFDLVAENGEVVGSVLQEVSRPYGDISHIPFDVYIPYAVRESTGVRLTIRQESATRIPGTVWLESWLLTLEP
jgi:hypothetical protein